MAQVRAFRALRYDEAKAGPLDTLVAPPYDVISPEERERYLARSAHNVVHLTLPDSEDEAGRDFAAWRREGILRGDEPAIWAIEQEYVGPDGVRRTRRGLVASLEVEPYERGVVLPHERTHEGPKKGRLRLLRAVRAHLEPIFLLYEGDPPYAHPGGEPELEAEGARLWRLRDEREVAAAFADKQLLIADGHHRYETALAFHEEDGTSESGWMMAVLVSTRDPGLMIFPTHRLAERLERGFPSSNGGDPRRALDELEREPRDHSAAVVYRKGSADKLYGREGELDPQLVERYAPTGVTYTAYADEAIAAVDEGRAEAAFLLRPTRIEDVFAVAQAGETMPQKSTYFYPKLLSGLLFHPLD